MEKLKVLFVCIHNSARSQMAEAFLKHYGGNRFEVESSGIEPGKLNPIVIEVMKELGLDISANITKDVTSFLRLGIQFDYVITVCDAANAERCPVFPGKITRLHWGFSDPSSINGTFDQKMMEIRIIRDQIEEKVRSWIEEIKSEYYEHSDN